MALTDGEGADRTASAPAKISSRVARMGMLVGGAAVALVVILVALPAGQIQPGAPDRIEPSQGTTYQRQVPGNPGLAKTETFATLGCYPGDVLLSGGYSGVDEGTLITANGPDSASSEGAWLVGWKNDTSSDAIDVKVVCLDQAFLPSE